MVLSRTLFLCIMTSFSHDENSNTSTWDQLISSTCKVVSEMLTHGEEGKQIYLLEHSAYVQFL